MQITDYIKNAVIFVKLFVAMIVGWSSNADYTISYTNTDVPSQELIEKLQNFESTFTYPFSDTEIFRIKHGKNGDYFGFFKQLGKPYYVIVTCKQNKTVTKIINNKEVVIKHLKGEIAAVGCAVLRTLKKRDGNQIDAWYLCDLKVNENYQGEHLPTFIAQQVALPRFYQCPRGFAIFMNPSDKDPKAARIFRKHGSIKNLDTQTLNLYTLTAEQVKNSREGIKSSLVIHSYMQPNQQLVFKSTSGVKDYIIFNIKTNNSNPWKLLHIKPGENNTDQLQLQDAQLQDDATYMICSIEGTPLDKDFKKILGLPSSTAQVVSYGMEDIDFNFLTSDQI